MIYIGIDPGANSGAWGAIDHNGAYIGCGDIEGNGTRIYPRMLKVALQDAIKRGQDGASIAIEQVGVMPGQGISSSGKFMRATGAIEATVDLLLYPYEFVTPQKWKKYFDLIKKDKKASLELARSKWESAPLKLMKHHGRAEALLIALWLLENED